MKVTLDLGLDRTTKEMRIFKDDTAIIAVESEYAKVEIRTWRNKDGSEQVEVILRDLTKPDPQPFTTLFSGTSAHAAVLARERNERK